jgi:TorA maturation chaperone TorD
MKPGIEAPSGPGCRALAPEDVARADLYGLLATLFFAGPDAGLLARLAAAEGAFGEPGSVLGRAWSALVQAAASSEPRQAGLDYDQVFIGTGRAGVSLYGSHYLTESFKELTLVSLRECLDALGLARQPGVSEPEDHLSGLLDVMRHLVLRGDDKAAIASQRAYFDAWIRPLVPEVRKAIEAAGAAPLYRAAANLLDVLVGIDAEALGIGSC